MILNENAFDMERLSQTNRNIPLSLICSTKSNKQSKKKQTYVEVLSTFKIGASWTHKNE